jgi:predicted nucleic acid-binding Zn ribbon protein
MAVRLRTTEGEIKEYGTTQVLFVPVEGSPVDKYVTGCGRKWKPGEKNQECNHLECAIYLAKEQRREGPQVFAILIMLAVVAIIIILVMKWIQEFGFALTFSGALTLLAFLFLIFGLRAGKRFEELTEYRDKGTINGIKAFQIFEDLEEARTKHWWQSWR